MKSIALTIVVACLSGCVSLMPPATGVSFDANSVVLVGKFEIVPSIDTQHEQKTYWNIIGDGRIVNSLVMFVGSTPKPIDPDRLRIADMNGGIEAEWGEHFFMRAPKEKTYFRGGMMQLDMANSERVWFPGGFYYQAPSKAKAIYIGTLRFYRGDFYVIKKVRLVDEYTKVLPAFKKQFGSTAVLTKALLKHVK